MPADARTSATVVRRRELALSRVEAFYRISPVRLEMDQYKVRPRKLRDGWNLEGERLSHGSLWYKNESAAIGYARWNSRVNGCRIEVLDEKDNLVRVDQFPAGDFTY